MSKETEELEDRIEQLNLELAGKEVLYDSLREQFCELLSCYRALFNDPNFKSYQIGHRYAQGLYEKLEGGDTRLKVLVDEIEYCRGLLSYIMEALSDYRVGEPLKRGDYGWSYAYYKVLELRNKLERLEKGLGCGEEGNVVSRV